MYQLFWRTAEISVWFEYNYNRKSRIKILTDPYKSHNYSWFSLEIQNLHPKCEW